MNDTLLNRLSQRLLKFVNEPMSRKRVRTFTDCLDLSLTDKKICRRLHGGVKNV